MLGVNVNILGFSVGVNADPMAPNISLGTTEQENLTVVTRKGRTVQVSSVRTTRTTINLWSL